MRRNKRKTKKKKKQTKKKKYMKKNRKKDYCGRTRRTKRVKLKRKDCK